MSYMGYKDIFGCHSCLTEEEIYKMATSKDKKTRIKVIKNKK